MTLKASYIPHWAPVRVPIMTMRRGSPLVKRPRTPICLTACRFNDKIKSASYSVIKKRIRTLNMGYWREHAYISHCSTLGIVEERDQVVSWMRNNGTEDTSDVATSKADTQLERLAALRFWNWNCVLVDEFNNGLEGSKLHHGV
jgi:hypothetical protein